jgi:hypothetical protein
MIKRGTAALAIALAATFASVVGAEGAGRLSLTTAKQLARTLVHRQAAKRDLVSQHLGRARRVNANTIVFAYDDRTRKDNFCKANLVVRRTTRGSSTRFSARIQNVRCARVPSDALATESATRSAVRALRRRAGATKRSLARLVRSVKRCRSLSIPRSRRDDAAAMLDIATVEAIEGPNDAALGDFVTRLGGIDTSTAVLQRAIAAWSDWLGVIRSQPAIADPCDVLRRWARAGWSDSAAPIDMDAYRRDKRRTGADERAIARGSRYLVSVGVVRRTAVQFTPVGLLLHLAP